ncbi:MAG: lysyl oxidase family protein [Acidobacteriota bacterium]|nr:lysyl oxidase family protein [Acidobacteriota bacterium]
MLQPNEFRLELLPGSVRRLRFSTYIVNIGPGRFDAYGSQPDLNNTTLTNVTQRVDQGSGVWAEHPTEATMFYAGDGHDHWHVYGLQDWKLAFQATPNDRIATGTKTGFCFWDNVNLSNAFRYYTGSVECHQRADGTVPMGLSVSWGDKYPWSIGFQYIDVSHLPNGNYCLTQTADPLREFIEANTANNSIQTLISIGSSTVTVLAPNCSGTPESRVVHVADLDRTARGKGKSSKWEAFVTVTVRDAAGSAVAGATVNGNWSGALNRSVSGVTGSGGSLTLGTGQISGGTSVTFTVTGVAGSGLSYDPAANTDPDPDGSNGTTITIPRP